MSGDRIKITIAVSLAVHLGLLCLMGATSAARPIDVEQLKVVKVDLVKEPDHLSAPEPDKSKPEKIETPKPPPDTHVPPPQDMKTDPQPPKPSPKPMARSDQKPQPRPVSSASSRLPGDPGGALNTGTPSPRGEDLGHTETGSTPVGWVPSPTGGDGSGSGTGHGVGRPDPVPDAVPGPGREPAPQPPPPAPPPKMVDVMVCQVSGDRPGPNCEKTVKRSFVEGRQPRKTCDKCKPQPKHESRLAAVQDAQLIKDVPVVLPDSVRETGIDTSVTVAYTIGADGKVTDISVTKSSGNPAVDRAVVSSAAKLKYKPAMQDGIPRSVKAQRTYRIRC